MILQQGHPSTNSATTEQETQSFTGGFLPKMVLSYFPEGIHAGNGCQVHVWEVTDNQ